jgi:hypothetical protein
MERIYWSKFVPTDAFEDMQLTLQRNGYHLVAKFDKTRKATDVYIVKLPEGQRFAAPIK